jgi:hypothetical protein
MSSLKRRVTGRDTRLAAITEMGADPKVQLCELGELRESVKKAHRSWCIRALVDHRQLRERIN